MKAMILAAGLGTRFRPHTEKAPKPTFSFLNTPFLFYAAHLAETLNPEEIIINTHHLPPAIEKTMSRFPHKDRKITFSFEKEILGSGGAYGKVREALDNDHFLALNADTVVLLKQEDVLKEFLSEHQASSSLATLMVTTHPEVPSRYGGVWADDSGLVFGFGKENPQPEKSLKAYHFYGIQLFHPRVLNDIPNGFSNIFTEILSSAIARGEKVKVFNSPATFFDGGYLEGFLKDSKIALELFPQSPFLQSIAKNFWPNFEQRKNWQCGLNFKGTSAHTENKWRLFGNNVSIDESTELHDLCILGNNVTIEDGCHLENVVIDHSVTIPKGSIIKNQYIL